MTEQQTTVETAQVIVWSKSFTGALHGKVGKISMFTISYGFVRDAEEKWNLRTGLPGFKDQTAMTEEDAKAKAEVILQRFLNYVARFGAVGTTQS